MPPIAATVATPEPEIAAKIMQQITVIMLNAPERWPISALIKLISFSEIPVVTMTSPEIMKNGTASSENESQDVNMVWIRYCTFSESKHRIVTNVDIPSA